MKLKKGPDPTKEATITADELEKYTIDEVNDVLTSFKQRRQDENTRLQDATDSEHWVALCFQTRAQKEEFLDKAYWRDIGDKYLDGMKCAKKMNITLESPVPPVRRTAKFGAEYNKRIIP
ncbi:hypothetical protein AGMMS49992_20260 [Clostridia bacterium]|nr:hypothetical protein AGMMS49992_20260 [Clostridia bacterium]